MTLQNTDSAASEYFEPKKESSDPSNEKTLTASMCLPKNDLHANPFENLSSTPGGN